MGENIKRMKMDGHTKYSKRGFERYFCLVDNDKERDLAGWSACWAGQAAKSWQDMLVIAVPLFSRNYSLELIIRYIIL